MLTQRLLKDVLKYVYEIDVDQLPKDKYLDRRVGPFNMFSPGTAGSGIEVSDYTDMEEHPEDYEPLSATMVMQDAASRHGIMITLYCTSHGNWVARYETTVVSSKCIRTAVYKAIVAALKQG